MLGGLTCPRRPTYEWCSAAGALLPLRPRHLRALSPGAEFMRAAPREGGMGPISVKGSRGRGSFRNLERLVIEEVAQ